MSPRARRRWLRSPFARFTAIWLVALAVLATVILIPIYRGAVAEVRRELDGAIDEELLGLEGRFEREGLAGLVDEIARRVEMPRDRDAVYVLTDGDGTVLAGNLGGWIEGVPRVDGARFVVTDPRTDASVEGRVFALDDARFLMIGRRSPLAGFESEMRERVAIDFAWLLIGTGLIAWLFTRDLRRRLEHMAQAAEAIRRGDLHQRLSLNGSGDELDELAERFNRTFADLQKSMDGIKYVSSAIAHDMRQPLSRLRNSLDEITRAPDLPEPLRARLESSVGALDESLAVGTALLRLARIEAGALGTQQMPLALDDVVRDAVELYAAMAEAEGRELHARLVPATITGDRDLLFQLAQNLLENALRHGAGAIDVAIAADGEDRYTLEVRDHGEGVPEDALPRLGEYFFRVDEARSAAGSGIGLSLCRAIAECHGARLELSNAEPGLRARVIGLGGAR